ncbi:hypothetical protein SEUCBS140593_010693 [Sporothrix eucalyptigena]|uniref:C2H2-type domain-containing protein n=1 Tax=Sporothrix eucalyptigena TaxID=1812306 RepID=A0ABP0D313_9PEZI
MASRSGTETSMPSHSRTASASPFPPPTRALQFPYQLEPTGAYAPGSNASGSNGYLSDGTAVFWGQATASADQFYSAPGAHRQPSASSFPERHPRGSRPRRQPRRLTTKEEANFQCEVKGCGKLFSRSYNYKAHMETHDEKREYPFPCQVPDCGKRHMDDGCSKRFDIGTLDLRTEGASSTNNDAQGGTWRSR